MANYAQRRDPEDASFATLMRGVFPETLYAKLWP
jgi:hypothetical protein